MSSVTADFVTPRTMLRLRLLCSAIVVLTAGLLLLTDRRRLFEKRKSGGAKILLREVTSAQLADRRNGTSIKATPRLKRGDNFIEASGIDARARQNPQTLADKSLRLEIFRVENEAGFANALKQKQRKKLITRQSTARTKVEKRKFRISGQGKFVTIADLDGLFINERHKTEDEIRQNRFVETALDRGKGHAKGTETAVTETQSSARVAQEAVMHAGTTGTDGVYWVDDVERWIPEGLRPSEASERIARARQQRVVSLQTATSLQCGRPQNGVVTMTDGAVFCAKHRAASNDSILGNYAELLMFRHEGLEIGTFAEAQAQIYQSRELMSFHLSHLLGMDNVPPVLLSYVSMTSHSPWADVIDTIPSLLWSRGIYVALIGWIAGLQRNGTKVAVPSLIARALKTGIALDSEVVTKQLNCACVDDAACRLEKEKDLALVAQWGTMVVFDYLTANYDRAASVSDPGSPVRNLRQTSQGKFWLLDNEAAFFQSYLLVHQGSPTGNRLQRRHLRHLHSTCIFQRSLVHHLMDLWRTGNPAQCLTEYVRMREPLFDRVTVDSAAFRLFSELFSRRVSDVVEWVNYCRSLNK